MRDKIDFQGSKIWVPWGAYCNLGGPNPKIFYIFSQISHYGGGGNMKEWLLGKKLRNGGRKKVEKGGKKERKGNGLIMGKID